MKRKHMVASKIVKLVICFLVFSLALGSFAWAESAVEGNGTTVKMNFPDVAKNHWANKFITKMALLDVVKGSVSGNFNPDNKVSQQDAVIMAMKLLGYNDTNIDKDSSVVLPFGADDYAKAYIRLAIEKGFLNSQEELSLLGAATAAAGWGKKDATREWVAKIVIRSIGKQADADRLKADDSSFSDDLAISAWAKGFVNAAVKLNIVKGFDSNNTFRPTGSVTRAQMTAFLSNAEPYLKNRSAMLSTGTITNLTRSTLTVLDESGKTKRYQVDAGAVFFAKNFSAPLLFTDPAFGSKVKQDFQISFIQSEGIVYFVEVTNDQVNYDTGIAGTLVSKEGNKLNLTVNGQAQSFNLVQNVTVLDKNGNATSLDALMADSTLELKTKTVGGQTSVVQIIVKDVPVNKTTEATVESVDVQENIIEVLAKDTGQTETYPFAAAAVIKNDKGTVMTTADLYEGDVVQIEVKKSQIASLNVTKSVFLIEEGKLEEIKSKQTIYFRKTNNQPGAYDISSSVDVNIQGLPNATLEDLMAGDSMKLVITAKDNLVTKITVLNRIIYPNMKATIVNYNRDKKYLTVEDANGDPQVYEMTAKTAISMEGTQITLDSFPVFFQSGYKVKISVTGKQLVSIELDNKYSGTVTSKTASSITIYTDNNERVTFTLTGYVSIDIYNKTSAALNDLNVGDQVQVILSNTQDRINKINVSQTVQFFAVSKDTVNNRLSVKDVSGVTSTYTIDSSISVVRDHSTSATLSGIAANGEPIILSFNGKTLKTVRLVDQARGQVTAVDEANGTVTVQDYTSGIRVLRGTGVKVTSGSSVSTYYSAVKPGDRVEIYKDASNALAITIIPAQRKTVWQFNVSNNTISFKRSSLSENSTFMLGAGAYLHSGTQTVSLQSFKDGDEVNAYFLNGKIIEIEKL